MFSDNSMIVPHSDVELVLLAGYRCYFTEHFYLHHRLAGGNVLTRVFLVVSKIT